MTFDSPKNVLIKNPTNHIKTSKNKAREEHITEPVEKESDFIE
jgi:hypothetical protein